MKPHPAKPSALVATIGAEPQVISLAMQLLRQRGENVAAVEVLHTDPGLEPIHSALSSLRSAFTDHRGWPPLQEKPIPANDLLLHEDMVAFQTTLFQSLKDWIRREHRVRLLLAGGRKTSAMMGMVIAHMLLRPCDQVLYLFSDEALRLSRRHILKPGDRVQLYEIPLPPRVFPMELAHMMQAQTPSEAHQKLEEDRRGKLARFMEILTPGEKTVAEIIAHSTQSNEEVAQQLNLSSRTVSNRLTSIYRKLEEVWDLSCNKGIKRETLRLIMNS